MPMAPHMGATSNSSGSVPVAALHTSVYVIPTDTPESDGTLEWDRTTMVLVEISAGGVRGLGYTYASSAAATLIRDSLEKLIVGQRGA